MKYVYVAHPCVGFTLLFDHIVKKLLYFIYCSSDHTLPLSVLLFRFCEEVFHGPLSVQEQWITHLQKHILSLGYKGKASPPAAPVEAPALVHPVAV